MDMIVEAVRPVRKYRPHPTGTATEAQRIEFITTVAQAGATMIAQGGRKAVSPVRQILRHCIFSFWEAREFHKMDPRRLRSVAAAQSAGPLVYDHTVPVSVIADRILNAPQIDAAVVHDALVRWSVACIITADENARLDRAGLRQKMPAGWDGIDVFARYRHPSVNIAVQST